MIKSKDNYEKLNFVPVEWTFHKNNLHYMDSYSVGKKKESSK